ncbi:MAG: hypothetical protein FWE68_06585, partial [Defluviitaleaceae bacterium]|nr:hypothetical protein [Defluviitaleaceae bacterium]
GSFCVYDVLHFQQVKHLKIDRLYDNKGYFVTTLLGEAAFSLVRKSAAEGDSFPQRSCYA